MTEALVIANKAIETNTSPAAVHGLQKACRQQNLLFFIKATRKTILNVNLQLGPRPKESYPFSGVQSRPAGAVRLNSNIFDWSRNELCFNDRSASVKICNQLNGSI